jgi:hypothetical protein
MGAYKNSMKKDIYFIVYRPYKNTKTIYKKPIYGNVLTVNNRQYGFIKDRELNEKEKPTEYTLTDIKTGLAIINDSQHIKTAQEAIDFINKFDISVIKPEQLKKFENSLIDYPIYLTDDIKTCNIKISQYGETVFTGKAIDFITDNIMNEEVTNKVIECFYKGKAFYRYFSGDWNFEKVQE